jgi:hypothetical protein
MSRRVSKPTEKMQAIQASKVQQAPVPVASRYKQAARAVPVPVMAPTVPAAPIVPQQHHISFSLMPMGPAAAAAAALPPPAAPLRVKKAFQKKDGTVYAAGRVWSADEEVTFANLRFQENNLRYTLGADQRTNSAHWEHLQQVWEQDLMQTPATIDQLKAYIVSSHACVFFIEWSCVPFS